LGPISADVDHCVESKISQPFCKFSCPVDEGRGSIGLWHGELQRIALVGSLENGSTFYMNASCLGRSQPHQFRGILEYPVECFNAPVNFPSFFAAGAFADASDDSIKPGAITSAGEDE